MTQALRQPDSEILQHTVPSWKGITHGFFGRRGGFSAGIYESLNCGVGSQDNPEAVHKNRALIAQALGVPEEQLLSLYQIHSDICINPNAPYPERPQADAHVTDKPGLALGVLTADCAPVLFYGEKADGSPVIGAAHAGWGGALKGVLENTVRGMKDLGAVAIEAAIGPCIGKASYEVTEAFAEPFLNEDETAEKFFSAARKEGHLMFDLAGYCAFRLARAGLKDVSLLDKDTYAHEADYFSFRRATHRNDPDYGRQLSVIVIK